MPFVSYQESSCSIVEPPEVQYIITAKASRGRVSKYAAVGYFKTNTKHLSRYGARGRGFTLTKKHMSIPPGEFGRITCAFSPVVTCEHTFSTLKSHADHTGNKCTRAYLETCGTCLLMWFTCSNRVLAWIHRVNKESHVLCMFFRKAKRWPDRCLATQRNSVGLKQIPKDSIDRMTTIPRETESKQTSISSTTMKYPDTIYIDIVDGHLGNTIGTRLV